MGCSFCSSILFHFSYGLNQIVGDFNTPLSKENDLYFRLNTAYTTEQSFQDAGFRESFFVAPSLSYRVNNRLSFSFYGEITKAEQTNPTFLFSNRSAPTEASNLEELGYNNKLSFGFGSEYKYDWGHYQTTTFSSQTRGHLSNLGIFANAGYKFNENQILSFHGRNDDHKETGGNKTYKINFTQLLGKFKLGATHSTGLKNASLYELYGNIGQKNINPEKSETNELIGEYNFSENIKFSSTAYRTRMKDRIKINSSWDAYENKVLDTTQEGLENELSYNFLDQKISLMSNF